MGSVTTEILRKAIPQATHRILFKFNVNCLDDPRAFFEKEVAYLGLKHSELVDYKATKIGDMYHMQIDVVHPQLPDPRGQLVSLLDETKRVVKEWYQ